MNIAWRLIICLLLNYHISFGQYYDFPKGNPIELGKVNWLRDFDAALQQSKEKKLPVFILFQEVPGCGNCTKFGNEILSHPLIVEAIETYFIPLCIYNNASGRDKIILQRYNEPAWNNPVLRVVDQNGDDLISRQPDFRSATSTVQTICNALKISGQEMPKYLELLLDEIKTIGSANKDEAYFSMYCFWTGEREIAALEGVVSTEAGFMNKKEVVHIIFDSSKTKLKDLVMKARKVGCADEIYARADNEIKTDPIGTFRKDQEDKYFLSHSMYKRIPMLDIQKTQVNRAIALKQDPTKYLSQRQLNILKIAKSKDRNHLNDQLEAIWWK